MEVIRSLWINVDSVISATLSFAGEAKVTFKDVDKYTDFEPANGIEVALSREDKRRFH